MFKKFRAVAFLIVFATVVLVSVNVTSEQTPSNSLTINTTPAIYTTFTHGQGEY